MKVLRNGSVLVSQGPLHMTVGVSKNGTPSLEMARQGAEKALRVLEDLAGWLNIMKLSWTKIKKLNGLPLIVQHMVLAAQRTGDPAVTPLAAVAGAVSDQVADFLEACGGTRIIVNNGGDIALRLHRDETVKVGIRMDVQRQDYTYNLVVNGRSRIGGVATSGLGGRSFTKGVASAAVCIGSSAVYADAAATVVGNSTWVEDPSIETELAEILYPDTDIVGQRVVTRVGEIGENKIEEAIQKGRGRASLLIEKGLIRGAMIGVKGRIGWTPNLECRGRNFYLNDDSR
ncbi:MAG: hypothetical protein GTN74_04845 [Proteobacteria bacterium]|nr:hypothetical protein [Pseudomonadota bacterium]NIS68791.1 hypothetical protein [Pseudomonadota bacterium]